MDMSKLSTADLEAFVAGDMTKVSTAGLQYLTGNAPDPSKSGFVPAVKAGWENLKGDVAGLAGRTGLMDIPAAEKYQAEKKQEAARLHTPTQDDWSESPWLKVKELAGGSAPYMAAPLAAGAAATFAGAPALAAAGAAGLASGAQFTATNIGRQQDEGVPLAQTDIMGAALAAAPQAALDMVGLGKIPGVRQLIGMVAKDVGKEAAERIAGQAFQKTLLDYAKKTGTAMGAEGITEAGQQVFERMQAGLNLTDDKARKEYWDNFVGGAVLGGAMAPAGRYVERGQIEGKQRAEDLAAKNKEQQAAREAEAQKTQEAEAAKQTPEYAKQVVDNYTALEQQRLALQKQLKNNPKTSPTYAADAETNKQLQLQIADLKKQARELAPEYNALKDKVPAPPPAEAPAAEGKPQDLFGEAPVQPDAPAVSEVPMEVRRDELSQQIRMLPDLLEQHRDAAAKAATPEEALQHVAKFDEVQRAIAKATEEHAQLPQLPAPNTLQKQLESQQAKLAKAQELGDTEAISRAANRILELRELGATQGIISSNTTKKPWGSETTESFNQRVVGPEMAAGREAAEAQRKKVADEQAALQRIAAKPVDNAYPEVRKDKAVGAEIAQMEKARINPLKTEQLTIPGTALPLASKVVRGAGTPATKTEEEFKADYAAAKETRNRPAMLAAIEGIRDARDRATNETPEGAATRDLAAVEPANYVRARGQALVQLLQAKPEDAEAARGRLLERLAADIEDATGKQMPQSQRYALAAEANPVLDTLLNSSKQMTDAKKAQAALDAIRNRLAKRERGVTVDTSFAKEKPEEATPAPEPDTKTIDMFPEEKKTAEQYVETEAEYNKLFAPKVEESQADREARDAEARIAEQKTAENLAELPGVRVSHEAYRVALEELEGAPVRAAELLRKGNDETLPKTTRDKAKRQVKALNQRVILASGMLAHDGAKMAAAKGKVEEQLAKVREKIDNKRAAAEEAGIKKSTMQSRRRELSKLVQEERNLNKLNRSLENRAKITPIKTGEDKRAAAEDRAAEKFLEQQLALQDEGTTGKLPSRKIGPIVKKAVQAGNVRTGSLETAEERQLPARNKIEQSGAKRQVTSKQAVRAAERDAPKISTPETQGAAVGKDVRLSQGIAMVDALIKSGHTEQAAEIKRLWGQVTTSEKAKAGVDARVKALEEARDKATEQEDKDSLQQRIDDQKETSKDHQAAIRALEEQIEEVRKQRGKPSELFMPDEAAAPAKTKQTRSEWEAAQDKVAPATPADVVKEGTATRELQLVHDIPGTVFDTTSAWHGKTYAEAARIAAEDASSPMVRAMLLELADKLENAPNTDMTGRVYVVDTFGKYRADLAANHKKGRRATPHYDPTRDFTIVASDNFATNHGKLADEILLHELTHAATYRGIFLDTPLAKKLRADLAEQLRTVKAWIATEKGRAWLAKNWQEERLFGIDPKTVTLKEWYTLVYGVKNPIEMLSEAMSNPQFQKLLTQIRTGADKPNLFTRFINAVSDYLGFKLPAYRTALHDILALTEQAATSTAETYASPKLWRDSKVRDEVEDDAPDLRIDYGSEAGSPLAEMAEKYTARPVSFLERIKQNFALSFEQGVVDMRAAHAAAMKMGRDSTMDSGKLTQQAIYDIRKGDQLMPLVQMTVMQGPPVSYTDSEGLHGIKSTGKNSLREVYEEVEKLPGNAEGKMALATNYMIAQRVANVGLDKAGWGDMKMDAAELSKVMDYVNANPDLKAKLDAVRTKYNAYNEGLVNFMASTGAIPKSLANKLLQDGDYVSMYRVDKNGHASLLLGSHVINIGEVRHQRGLEALKGGDTKILPINESLLRNTTLLLGKSMDNQAAKSAAYAYQDLGAGTIKRGEGPADPSVLHFHQEPDPKDKADEGKRWIKIDTTDTVLEGIPAEMIVKALEGTNIVIPSVLRFAAAASDMLRSGVTRMPTYALRQLIRDPMVSVGTAGLGGNPLTAVFKAGKEFLAQTQGKSEAAQRLAEKGLIQSQIFSGDTHDLKKLALQLADKNNHNAIQHLFAVMDRASMHADAATRVLVHENALKNGLSEVQADLMTMESMNFHKRGASATIQYAHRLIPFFSSQIQGLSVLAKAARGNMPFNEQLQIKKKFFNNAVLLFASGLAYAAAMEDDDYYKNAKPRDKMSFWFVHLPGVDEPIKIPIPFEYGFFFSAAVAAVEGMKEDTDNEQQFAAIRDMLLNAVPGYSNKGVPQFAKPIAELATNKDFYSWNPIESESQKGMDPERRFNKNTSEMSKRLSQMLPILSPIQIERLVNGYFGQAPLMIAGAVNTLFAEEGAVPRAEGHVTETPFFGQSFQRKYGGEDAEAVYALANKATMAKKSFDDIAKEGNRDKAVAYQKEHIAALRAAPLAEKFRAAMAELTKNEKAIRLRNIPPDAKQKQLDGIDETRQRVAEQYKKAFQRVSAAAGT